MSEPLLLADENLHRRIIEALRGAGCIVRSIREESPGLPDRGVLQIALEAGAVLVTEDSDFGELVFAHAHPSLGIVYLRYAPGEVDAISASLLGLIKSRPLLGKFYTLTATKIRTRELP